MDKDHPEALVVEVGLDVAYHALGIFAAEHVFLSVFQHKQKAIRCLAVIGEVFAY